MNKSLVRTVVILLTLCFLISVSYAQPTNVNPRTFGASDAQEIWWFDRATMSVCYRLDLAHRCFKVDFDGDHSTSTTDTYGDWSIEYGTEANLGVTRTISNGTGGLFAWAFKIGEQRIDGPNASINGADWWVTDFHVNKTEWFYYWVEDTIPPTDWVVHIQRSNGTNPKPVSEPFWYTLDYGKTWNLFSPSVVPVVQASVTVSPRTINLESQGRWVMAFVTFPEGTDVNQIDKTFSIMLNESIAEVGHWGRRQYLAIKFDRQQVENYAAANLVPQRKPVMINLVLSGKLRNGTIFQGSTFIKVVTLGTRAVDEPFNPLK